MDKNSSIHSLREKRAESKSHRNNEHLTHNLQSLANDIINIERSLNTLKQTSRQKSLSTSHNSLYFMRNNKQKSKQKKKKRSPLKENVDYDDHYYLKPLDKIKRKSRTYKDDQDKSLVKEAVRDTYPQSQQGGVKNPADIVTKFHEDMLMYVAPEKRSQFEGLLRKMIKLL